MTSWEYSKEAKKEMLLKRRSSLRTSQLIWLEALCKESWSCGTVDTLGSYMTLGKQQYHFIRP